MKAVFKDEHGFESQRDRARALGMKKGDEFTVAHVEMGGCSTSIQLEEFPGEHFNSVMFDFFKNGELHDIYRDPKYNPYIPRHVPERAEGEPKRLMGTIKNAVQYRTMICGNVYGHPDFQEGTLIHTSKVESINPNPDGKYEVETRNSRYKVEFAEGSEFKIND